MPSMHGPAAVIPRWRRTKPYPPRKTTKQMDKEKRTAAPVLQSVHFAHGTTSDGLCHVYLAEWTGLEPATPGVTGRYSNQLNYHSWQAAFRLHLSIQAKRYNLATLRGFEPRYSP
jgi:hypothetical protein